MNRLLKLADLFRVTFLEPLGIDYPRPTPVQKPAAPVVVPPPVRDTPPPRMDVTPVAVDFIAPVLFVRVGAGRGSRYRLDDGTAAGPKFRKTVLANGRTKYLPA